jgi:hypothetical protein
MRTVLSLSIAGLFAGSAFAQFPGGYLPSPGYGPGFGGTAGIPGLYGGGLSPYLNLRNRNTSSAVNYFNFTRPYTGGTFGGAIMPSPLFGGQAPAGGMSRFFPNQIPAYAEEEPDRQRVDEKAKPDANGLRPVDMPPAGHGGGFMNTMGFFGSPNGLSGGAARPAATLGRPRGR